MKIPAKKRMHAKPVKPKIAYGIHLTRSKVVACGIIINAISPKAVSDIAFLKSSPKTQ